MEHRHLGGRGPDVSVLGFGAFKVGRTVGIKYPTHYDLPDEAEAARLLGGVLDLGYTLIDTAPSYGVSEERIGRHLGHRRSEFVLSTKVGERFENGVSTYDFTPSAIRRSVAASLRRLRTDAVDVLLVHSDGEDEVALAADRVPETMLALRDAGFAHRIGFSGKTVAGAVAAMTWADVLMVTYHAEDASHDAVMRQAREAGVGIIVKKALASGHHPASEAIPFALGHPAVDAVVIGGLDLAHLRANAETAAACVRP